MKDFQDKNKNGVLRRIFYSKFGIGFLTLIILTFGWGVMDFMVTMKETARNRDIAQDKVIELEKRKEKLVRDIDALNTDKGKEKVFREDFGMGREGEGLIIVIPDKSTVSQEDDSDRNESSSFKQLFNRLLDIN